MKYIVVIIPKFKFYKVIFEKDFIDGKEYRTQNEIIQVLETLSLEYNRDFTCDLLTEKEEK